jgi:selenocysteine lyase/cysteine desulfurase
LNVNRFPAVMAAAAHGRILADNAAGAQLPDSALERLQRYLTYDNSQRGAIFTRTRATSELVEEAKAEFAALIAAPAAQVGVGLNATSIAMTLSRLIASSIRRGDRIVVTAADHEANVAPWVWLQRFGAQIDIVPVDENGEIDEAKYLALLDRAPVLVALPWASNATGSVYDVARFAQLAKAARALVVVDGVQAFPHFALDIDAAIDFAFFSAYKVYAPHLGFWYASATLLERFVRADDAHMPGGDARYWTLECGTQSHEALAGWLGTIAYFRSVAALPRQALAIFAEHEERLAGHARAHFARRGPQLRLYGRDATRRRLPVFTFNVAGVSSDELGERFERAQIEARVGDFYTPRLMARIAPENAGRGVRLSFAHYNTMEEVDRCFDVIDAALAGSSLDAETEAESDAETDAKAEAEPGGDVTSDGHRALRH